MLTTNEINTTLTSTAGTLKVSINRMANGKYQVDSTFFDNEGYYVAHKSNTRIVDNIEALMKS